MKFKLTILLLFFIIVSNAQNKIIGKVIDGESKKPLEGINIFLSNTTNGTVTNARGEFQLDRLKPGKYELVATSLNYEDNINTVLIGQNNESIYIILNPTYNQLKEVVVESYDENGWEKWGDSFKSYFVGTPQLARNCIFKNPEVLKFKFGANSNKLRAFTNEKLIFENAELGYRIIYLLSRFEIDFNNNTFSFKGYPLFEEMKSNKPNQIAEWNKARKVTYNASIRHFIRSLYNNQLNKDGFEIRKVVKVSREEEYRVKEILKKLHTTLNKDSLDYYIKVRNLSFNENKITLNKVLSRDDIVVASNELNAKTLYFNDYLQVTNLNKKIPNEFAKTLPVYRMNENTNTDIYLRTNSPIFIYPNGDFYNGLELLTDGYWAWSEKLSTMLPSDYDIK
jgi:hypothetical protein